MVIQCAICVTVIIAVTVGLYFSGKFYFSETDYYFQVVINSSGVLFETDEEFLSVALDISFMRCFFHNFSNSDWQILEKLSSPLSPAYLRIGGTNADRTVFEVKRTSSPLEGSNASSCGNYTSDDELIISGWTGLFTGFETDHAYQDALSMFSTRMGSVFVICMSCTVILKGPDLVKLNSFARKANLRMIFNLNVLLRNESRWDSTNAQLLINFADSKNLPMDFQLGNEPNSFRHVFNITIPGGQLADDFYQLKKILNSTKNYKRSKLIGPDVTSPKISEGSLEYPSLAFLDEFLSKGNSVDVVSWHQYYLKGHNASLKDFTNLATFKLLHPEIESGLETVRKYFSDKPVWLSETGSASGGGAPGLSDKFAASFLWIDKLGMAAQSKVSVVIRQSLFKGHYALVGEDFSRSPDYWISILYKHLVGKRVLDVNVRKSEGSGSLRFYGHCVALNSLINGSIVIYGVNLSEDSKFLVPSMISISYPVYAFVFQPQFNNLSSSTVLLNDNELSNEAGVEDLVKMVKEVQYPLLIPSFSVGFWVLKEIKETACKR